MSVEENTAAFRRIPEELINTGNFALTEELIAIDYVEHVPLPPGMPAGVDGFVAYFTMLRTAFPDLRYTVEVVLAEGDLVAGHITARGTHRGAFMGIAPTGQPVAWTETHIARYAGGKLVEHWANLDQLSLLQQLGFIPAPGQAAG